MCVILGMILLFKVVPSIGLKCSLVLVTKLKKHTVICLTEKIHVLGKLHSRDEL